MNKIEVFVPPTVQYISEWKEYSIPFGKFIVDKGITGCGFTEYCLTNEDNIILCSPRRLLLQNKIDQHTNDKNILYLKNSTEFVAEYDASERDKVDRTKIAENYTEILDEFKYRIEQHLNYCSISHQPIKLLVTYDSFKYVYQFLGQERIKDFKIIIDEFQSIFTDSSFKANTELEFSEYIEDCPNVCYLSATPMLDEYLEKLDDYKDLDMYVFIWTSTYVSKALIKRQEVRSVTKSIKAVVNDYLQGKYPQIILPDKTIKESHEAVFYINSVADIVRIVNGCGLTPKNTDVICADTDKNRKKFKRIGFTISKPNTKDQMHLNKMFTFCTRTVYLGADFYSDNATSWVASNPNQKNLAIDISLDLPQIVGRQRLVDNPWKNQCTMFYQRLKGCSTEEEIRAHLKKKDDSTGRLLVTYDNVDPLTQGDLYTKYRDSANYFHDYVGISNKKQIPVKNYLVRVAEERFIQVTRDEYFNSINVKRTLEKAGFNQEYIEDELHKEAKAVAAMINLPNGQFQDKMKSYCEFCDKFGPKAVGVLDYQIGSKQYSNYYSYFGTKTIKGYGYREAPLKHILENRYSLISGEVKDRMLQTFKVGDKLTLKDAKTKIGDIYKDLGLTLKPKASDLEKYFEVKSIQFSRNRKRENGLEILSIK